MHGSRTRLQRCGATSPRTAPAPMLNRPVEQLRTLLPIGSAEECAEKLLAYEHAGAQRVFLWPLADERAQLEVFRERVVPLLDGERT